MEAVFSVQLMLNLVMEILFYNVKMDFILLINIWQSITLVINVELEQQHVKIRQLLTPVYLDMDSMQDNVNNVVQVHLIVQLQQLPHVLLNLLYQEEYVHVQLDKDQV
jgi:hypothetical protein